MRKKVNNLVLMICLLAVTLTAPGCYDIRELDRISIVTGVALDKAEQPGMIELTVQIGKAASLGGQEGGGNSPEEKPTQLIDAVAPSVMGALDSLRRDNSRTLFLHHNQVVIIGKEQAEAGITPYIDGFIRENETRLEVWLLIAEGKGKDVLNTEMELDKISAVGISQMIENKMELSKSLGINLLTFLSKISDQTTSSVIPMIRSIKEDDQTRLSLSNLAVIKNEKMIGVIPEEQTLGYAWVVGGVNGGTLKVNTDKGLSELKITESNSKLQPVFDKNGKLKMKLQIKGSFVISELIGFYGMGINQISELLIEGAVNSLKRQITSCYATAQRLKSDIFGFGMHIHRFYPGKWKSFKNDWDNIFSSLELVTDIQVEIEDPGLASNSPGMEKNKIIPFKPERTRS